MQPATAEAITRHLSEAKRRYAHNTVNHRRSLLTRVATAHNGDLFGLTGEDIDRWMDGAGIVARTRNVYISGLSSFYKWAIRRGYTDTNPAADATRLKAPRAIPRPARGADLKLALAAADPRMYAWLALMAYTGLRCAEVAALEVSDLLWHLDPPVIHVRHGTKGSHERVVPMAEVVEQALRAFGLPRAGPVFRRPGTAIAISAGYVSRRTREHLDNLGISATPHMLRHYFASAFYEASLDIRATQSLMGHASPATTAIYARFAQSDAAKVVRKLGQD